MKVTKEHQDIMRELITPLDTKANRAEYRAGNFRRSELTKDVNKRYRWDLFWSAQWSDPNKFHEVLDANYNDAHLDTALRSIVKEL